MGRIKGIDQRQPIGEPIGQADGDQRALATAGHRRATPRARYSRADGVDMAILDHHGEVEHRHVGHAAVGMALVEIGAKQRILLAGRLRRHERADQVGIVTQARRWLALGLKSSTTTRTDTQPRQLSQAGR